MSKRNGILFIPMSYNGDSMLNILNVVFSEESCKLHHLPLVDRVTFLISADSPNKVRLGGIEYDRDVACDMLCRNFSEECTEFRKNNVKNYATDIPNVIMRAVKEVGRDRIIIDLTCGKKDITGSLYTSASISQIMNMIYVEVERDDKGIFYQLDKKDQQIGDKYKLIKYESLGEIERLASLNCMDFIFYKKNIQDLSQISNTAKIESYCSQLNHIVEEYFSDNKENYKNAIREVGLINEELVVRVSKYLSDKFPEYLAQSKIRRDMDVVRVLEGLYQDINTDSDTKKELDIFFGKNPVQFELFEILRVYRNRASHHTNLSFERDDVKLVLDILLHILNNLNSLDLLDTITGDNVYE